jgi:hypothetical protein
MAGGHDGARQAGSSRRDHRYDGVEPTITYAGGGIDPLVCGDGDVGTLRTIAPSQVQWSNNLLGRASRLSLQRLVRGC